MHITSSSFSLEESKTDLLAAGVFEDKALSAPVPKLDAALGGHLSEHVKEEGFKGAAGSALAIHTHGKLPFRKLALIGLGPVRGASLETFRRAAGQAVKLAIATKAKSLALWLPYGGQGREAVEAAMEGALLAGYRYEKYKKDKERKDVAELSLLGTGLNDRRFGEVLAAASVAAEATAYARDLVNTPALDMTPAHFVEEAKKVAAASKRVRLKTFNRAALQKMGCGGILAVAQGSQHEPFLVHLIYKPSGKARKRIVLVGKGVTFDSGGLSLKPADSMMDMKIDMAGAAAVIAVFKALAKLELPVEVHGVAALVENMPSGHAIRPGDIVRTRSGKTIEILNTDAEGRVTLADSLHYGAKLKPDAMIDLATLTGACMVALGEDIAGMMTDDDRLAKRLEEASARAGEPLWRLPLFPAYGEKVKSRHADVKNVSGSRYGGAINAGMFLKEFVPADLPWAHLDIAGPAYHEKDFPDHRSWGASGYGVRLLIEYLRRL